MEFSKIAEQNSWDEVARTTSEFRSGHSPCQGITSYLTNNGIDISRSVFPAVTEFDDNVYQGTLVNQDRRVLEFFIDKNNPGDSELDDVTDQLGPKDPGHPESDVKDLITMSLVFFDDENNCNRATG